MCARLLELAEVERAAGSAGSASPSAAAATRSALPACRRASESTTLPRDGSFFAYQLGCSPCRSTSTVCTPVGCSIAAGLTVRAVPRDPAAVDEHARAIAAQRREVHPDGRPHRWRIGNRPEPSAGRAAPGACDQASRGPLRRYSSLSAIPAAGSGTITCSGVGSSCSAALRSSIPTSDPGAAIRTGQ